PTSTSAMRMLSSRTIGPDSISPDMILRMYSRPLMVWRAGAISGVVVIAVSVAQRLSGAQHVLNPLDGARLVAEGDEGLALAVEEVLLVDPLAAGELAPAEDGGEARADGGVVFADVRPLLHDEDS